MFSIVDRYIVRSFLYSFVVFFFLFVGLFIVVETFSNIEDFISAGIAQLPATLLRVYAVRIFTIFQQTCPVVVVAAAMTTITRMNKNNELVPLKACGTSVYRILWPLFVLTFAVTGFFLVNQELIIPALADRIVKYEKLLRGKDLRVRWDIVVKDSYGTSFRIYRYRVFEKEMSRVVITEYFAPGKQKTSVTAAWGLWKRSSDGEYRWHLSNGSINRLNELGEPLPGYPDHFGKDGLIIDRDPEDFSRHIVEEASRNPTRTGGASSGESEVPWVHYILSDIVPERLEREELTYHYLSTSSLRGEISTFPPPVPAELLVSLHRRYSWPLANLVLLLLGLPFVLRQETRSLFLGIGICISICAAYFFVDYACVELGRKEILSPVAAAWLPVLLFGPVGVFLFDGIRS